MIILLVFAFLAGIFTILSPCILPILPILLSGGTLQGKRRPLGIILGLVASFTFFTLALTFIVHATGLSPNLLRDAAIILIFLFGVVMLFPKLSDRFAQAAAPIAGWGQKIQTDRAKSGFGGGFVFGIALGLLWTPCAGPILASITTLVATQAISLSTILITLAYSCGAGIPMFFIAYGGSKFIHSSRFLSSHTEGLRQFFGVLMLLTALSLALHWDMRLQQKISAIFPPILIEDNDLVKQELEKLHNKNLASRMGFPAIGKKAPEFTGITNWINSPPLSLMQLKGKVVLVDFWTYSCINCLRTLPYIEDWYNKYKDLGLVVIGVHTPEFEFEKDPKNVAAAAGRLGVAYPIAQDNDYATWEAYHNQYWPAHYLIDQNGNINSIHFGEGAYVETENEIRQLLGLQPLQMKEPVQSLRPISPETYLGTLRGHSYVPEITPKPNQIFNYSYSQTLEANQVGLKGLWRVEGEKITSESNDSFLDFYFLAQDVYLVLSGSSNLPVEVYLDGQKNHEFKLDADRKYDIVKTTYGPHRLSLKIPKGVSAYAFTFGG